MEKKFSVLSFAEIRRQEADAHPGLEKQSWPEEQSKWFRELVEDIRSAIAAPRGRTEEERQAYTDMLNRAVIGYEQDRRGIMGVIQDLLAQKRIHRGPPEGSRYTTLQEAIFAEVIGWNVLETVILNKGGLEEIQVIGERVFEVRNGIPAPSDVRFTSVRDLERLQQNLVLFNKDSLHVRKRWAEVALLDGSRVTMTGMGFTSAPTLTIRFYSSAVFELSRLAQPQYGTMTEPMMELLLLLIRCCFNLVVIGPTNSGKTSLIKALIREMPDHERLVTIESRYELMIRRDFPAKNCIEYEIDEDDPRHSSAQAFKLALRQSPKRICHAEIRDEDANIYVRACTRGHEGSVTTVHASSLEDAPEAIADMCMLDNRGMDPVRLVRRIAGYVTQVGLEMALVNGRRKLVRVGEYEYRKDTVHIRDWVRYDYTTGNWTYPMDVSQRAVDRICRHDPDGLAALQQLKEAMVLCC